jgi:hypothetical protein
MLDGLRRVAHWTAVVGGVCFAAGFFGPMILAPDANQGPLLGIFITGPLGVVAGLLIGGIREVLGRTATPLEIVRSFGIGGHEILRAGAGAGGCVLLLDGLRGLPNGGGRAAAAGIVVGGVLLWYAVAGRVPAWFRR